MVKTDTEMNSGVRSGSSKVAAEIWGARVMHEAPYWTSRVRRMARTAAFTMVALTVSLPRAPSPGTAVAAAKAFLDRRRDEMVRSRRPANEDINQKIKIESILLNGPLL